MIHMNGGSGEANYGSNSWIQGKVISLTRPIREKSINEIYYNTSPKTFCIADMGCSSGPNTLLVISELVETIHEACNKVGKQLPEFLVYLNDLPGNDFNTMFMSLPSFQAQMRDRIGPGFGSCFVTGVPGSFYERLFPSKSLHFVHSSYSLHWLSQVPKGIDSNGRNIYRSENSPPSVLKAYSEQFQADFSKFLKLRSEEIGEGGRMVLTFRGRISDGPPSKDVWDQLAMALNDMVSEGLIEEEKLVAFNIPEYNPSPTEIKSEVEKEGSFVVDLLEVSNVNWCANRKECVPFDSSKEDGSSFATCTRAVIEPLLLNQFGKSIVNEIFRRYNENIVEQVKKETNELTNVTASLRRVSE